MRRITAELLDAHGACSREVKRFQELFPRGAPVSMRSFNKAQNAGLSVFWAERLLTVPAWDEYKKVTERAWPEYDEKATIQSWAEYEKVRGRALVAALKEADDE